MTALENKKKEQSLCSLLEFGMNFLTDQLQCVHVT